MSFGVGFKTGGSTGSQQSSSKPVLFGPKDLRTKEVSEASRLAVPTILDKALSGGFNPEEKSRLQARLSDPVNRAFKSGTTDLRREIARSGLGGGAASQDISDLIEARIGGLGEAGAEVERTSRAEADKRMQDLLRILTSTEPFAIGTESKGKGSTQQPSGFSFGLGSA